MKQYIKDTLTEVNDRINRLQSIATGLIILFTDPEDGTPIAPITHPASRITDLASRPAPPKSRITHHASRIPRPAPISRRRADAATHNIAACLKLPNPFTAAAFCKVTGLTNNGSHSQLTRWKVAGLVKATGFGVYERTARFPAAAASAPSAKSNLSASERSSLETKLADACKQRDHSRENNRSEMVDLFQREIDRLEAQLK